MRGAPDEPVLLVWLVARSTRTSFLTVAQICSSRCGCFNNHLFDLSGHAVTVLDGAGNWNWSEVFAGGRHLATYGNGTTYFSLKDWLGTERMETNVDGSVKSRCSSLPFGDGASCDGSGDYTSLRFTGDEHDWESNLEHTLFRQYSSTQGRWLTPDPAGLQAVDPSNPQSWNRYAYVMNMPTVLTDPLGLDPCFIGTPNCPPPPPGSGDVPWGGLDLNSLPGGICGAYPFLCILGHGRLPSETPNARGRGGKPGNPSTPTTPPAPAATKTIILSNYLKFTGCTLKGTATAFLFGPAGGIAGTSAMLKIAAKAPKYSGSTTIGANPLAANMAKAGFLISAWVVAAQATLVVNPTCTPLSYGVTP